MDSSPRWLVAHRQYEKTLRAALAQASLRAKPGAKISEKRWARLDDTLREKAVKAGALPPYRVERQKKQRAKAAREATARISARGDDTVAGSH